MVVLIIFPDILQTVINIIMLSIGGQAPALFLPITTSPTSGEKNEDPQLIVFIITFQVAKPTSPWYISALEYGEQTDGHWTNNFVGNTMFCTTCIV